MNTTVIINLDYENQHSGKCRTLWEILEKRMERAGFIKSGQRFMTHKDFEMAIKLARNVMNGIDAEYHAAGQALRPYIRDFYCIPDAKIIDLWSPSVNTIEVHQMEAGAFERFFGSTHADALSH